MNTNDLITVTKKEIHCWKLCPCPACEREREKRTPTTSPPIPIRVIPLDAATALRLISRRPEGSLARQLARSN